MKKAFLALSASVLAFALFTAGGNTDIRGTYSDVPDLADDSGGRLPLTLPEGVPDMVPVFRDFIHL